LNDLPVSADGTRARRTLAGTPPLTAYFLDPGAYPPESDTFWVRGRARADVLLRSPSAILPDGRVVSMRVRTLRFEITNGIVPNRVVVSIGFRRRSVQLAPGEMQVIDMDAGAGVPYKPSVYPTNFIYGVSISTSAGFAPFLEDPGGSSDSRYLGAMVKIVPVYFNP
jgi:hypothetical protein